MTSERDDLSLARITLIGLMTLEGLRKEGKDREAAELAERTLDVFDRFPSGADGSITLTGMASTAAQGFAAAMRLEEFDRALAFAQREVAYGQKIAGEQIALVKGLNNRALAKQELGRLSEAMEDYAAALAAIRGSDEPDTRAIEAGIRNNQATLLEQRGESEAAMEAMRAATDARPSRLAEAFPGGHLVPLNNFAMIAHQQGRYDEAIGHWERALKDPACDDHFRGIILCNIAESYRGKGEAAKAIETLKIAAQAHRKSGSKGPLAIDLHNLAGFYQEQGQRQLATGVLKEAWDAIREVAPKSMYAIYILRLLAMQRLVEGDMSRARAGLKRAIGIYESMRPRIGRTEQEHQKALEAFRSVVELFLYVALDGSWVDEVHGAIEQAKRDSGTSDSTP